MIGQSPTLPGSFLGSPPVEVAAAEYIKGAQRNNKPKFPCKSNATAPLVINVSFFEREIYHCSSFLSIWEFKWSFHGKIFSILDTVIKLFDYQSK